MRNHGILLLLFISLTSFAQHDSLSFLVKPQHEWSLIYKRGWLSQDRFQGPSAGYFTDFHKSAFSFRLDYSYYFQRNLKAGLGLEMGGMEQDFVYEINEQKLPGLEKYTGATEFKSFKYAPFSISYDIFFMDIPFHIDYQVLRLTKRHELWLSAGLDMLYVEDAGWEWNEAFANDTGMVNVFKADFNTNYNGKINYMLALGVHYHFTFGTSHKIIVGLKTGISFQERMKGQYEFFPDIPELHSTGTFSNKFSYLGIDLGLAINNRRKILKMYQIMSRHHRIESKLFSRQPDTISNPFEMNMAVNLWGSQYLNTHPVEGKNNLEISHYWPAQFLFELRKYHFKTNGMPGEKSPGAEKSGWMYKDKRNGRFSTASGLELNINWYEFERPFFNSPLFYIDVPARINYDFAFSGKMGFSLGGGADMLIHLTDNSGLSVYTNYNNIQNPSQIWAKVKHYDNRLFALGTHALFRVYRYTKSMNKVYLSFRLNYMITKLYSLQYELLQDDNTYFTNSFDIKPLQMTLTLGYGITWKRRTALRD